MHNVYLIIFITSVIIIRNLDAKILEGYLSTTENWAFLARFCFLSQKGRFSYDFIINNKNSEANLLLYYDDQWPSVYPSNKTCFQREEILRRDRGQIVSLSPYSIYTDVSGCEFTSDEQSAFRCRSYREFLSARARWWFLALDDCNSKEGLNVSYWISLTNDEPGHWKEHFSADEFYILPELMIAVCLYILLIGFSIYVAFELHSRRLLHVSYKLFMLSLMAQLIGLLCEIHNYINRALTGKDLKTWNLIGNLLQAISETAFTTLLILMSVGYTVTKSTLTPTQRTRITAFIGLTIFLQLSLFVYQSEVFDPGLILYLYESPPGYGLLALKLLAWIVFVICCYKTSQNYSTKFHFYGSLLSLGSSWFLCQPLVVLTITFAVDKWIRESLEKGLSLWIVFIGHVTFLFVTRPSSANSNFPFHIRTTQVVPIDSGQGHSYEPRGRTTTTLFTLSHSPPPQYNTNITE